MFKVNIPGHGLLLLEHLVLDFNGTLAIDGKVKTDVINSLSTLSKYFHIHILTADTHNNVKQYFSNTDYKIQIISSHEQVKAKLNFIHQLDPNKCVAIGNGYNDYLMLQKAKLGIAVCQEEGLYSKTLLAADIIVPHILDAFHLFIHPLRLIATLRN
ncbi:Soluble P-type ATPase [Desulfonauticus submarinus]|uniref:Soluble P-type ATPase n=1 Tax=Desulfonauticus submarinus TaxID=206665 RepID=A0A1H0EKU7_9BACT|nr:HAD hydrolase family protein [Desulfonauticus submarinus]SDN83107.1 Soluble P-type ATPase [Desulfonauticus submarinus]